jgi:small GTP-binding protein
MPVKKGKTVTKAKKQTSPAKAKVQGGFKPATQKDIPGRVFRGHMSMVWRVAMPTNGRFALTSSQDCTVRHWDLDSETSGVEGRVILEGRHPFYGLAVTPGGERAAAGDGSGSIHLLDLRNSSKILALPTREEYVVSLAFITANGELLGSAADGFLRKWDAQTGEMLGMCKVPFGTAYGIGASTDGRIVVGAISGKGLTSWDGVSTKAAAVWREKVSLESPVSVSADGRLTLTGCTDGTVALWDLANGQRRAAFEGHSGDVNATVLTLDGRFAASGGDDQTVRLWHVPTGRCLAVLRGHNYSVTGIAITPDARRIASVSWDGTLRVWDIPASLIAAAEQEQKRGYMNAKVVLLGDSGVGKSGLAMRLWHDRWEKTESTHGMEIQRLALPEAGGEEGVEREVWLWDLAGQVEYRLVHQLYMEQTALALLVFDPQRDDLFASLTYWQAALQKIAGRTQPPAILVAARCDRPGLRLTIEELQHWAAARGLHGPVLTSAKVPDHPGTAELRQFIATLIPWERMEFRSTMDNFPPLKDAILALRDSQKGPGGVIVTPNELETCVRRAAPKLEFTGEDLRAVTGLLAGEGVISKLPYCDLVLLQPHWLNCYASTLVKLAGEDKDRLGHVPMELIQPGKLPNKDETPRLPMEDERQLLPELVSTFLQRALAWKQDTGKGAMLVFPNYVRLPRPTPPERGRTVLYRFTGPLEEIYSTLVVRLHYSGLFKKVTLYRQAADFTTAMRSLAAVTLRDSEGTAELEIHFGKDLAPDVQATFQTFVDDHLRLRATALERLRTFHCPRCHEEARDRRAIDAALARGRTKLGCQYCDPDKNPGVIDLHDILEQQYTERAGEERAGELSRIASESISAASQDHLMEGEARLLVAANDQASAQTMSAKRFRIALSFAGEKRDFVEKVASLLAAKFGEDAILYDKFHEAEFARYNLGIYLPKLYSAESELIVPVLCKDYDHKRWTGWEWIHIYSLLTKQDGHRVMPCRFDNADADGLTPASGFIELDQKTPEQAAKLILERLALNEGRPKGYYLSDSLTAAALAAPVAVSTPPAPPAAPSLASGSPALILWKEKLGYLLEAEVIAVGADEKFRLKKQIEEAKSKIIELS